MSTGNSPRTSFTQQRNSGGRNPAGGQGAQPAPLIGSSDWRRGTKFYATLARGHRGKLHLPSWSRGHLQVYAPMDADKKAVLLNEIANLTYSKNLQGRKSVQVECAVISRELFSNSETRQADGVMVVSWRINSIIATS